MGCTKNCVQIFRIGSSDINREQQLFHFRQQLLGLFEEHLEKLTDINCHRGTPLLPFLLHCLPRFICHILFALVTVT